MPNKIIITAAVRYALSIAILLLLTNDASSQRNYWQQEVNFQIDVSLDDKDHSLDGFERIEYINHSPDTLHFIWFHIWPNAYKHDKTAFSDQLLENGNTAFYFSGKEDKGYINRLDFRVNKMVAKIEDHPQHVDIIKVLLPAPLAPGSHCEITTPFHVRLPYNFSRGGHDGDSYHVTQWYPKPAVYDQSGWHPMPYLDQGEFYSDFGNYTVDITLPSNYVVAATGELQTQSEKEWLQTRKNFSWTPSRKKIKSKSGSIKYIKEHSPATAASKKTIRFSQSRVHDFAWFADKRFIVDADTLSLSNGHVVNLFSFYTPEHKDQWHQAAHFAKQAVKLRSGWIGNYPYNTASVVQGPESFGGGMEYPTITVISPQASASMLDATISHEVGHNWFYGILASNERAHPWMDEGLNTYYDNRYSVARYGKNGEIKTGNASVPLYKLERVAFETQAAASLDQPINTGSEKLSVDNYGLIPYYKMGAWLEMLERKVGTARLDSALREFYRTWQFRHPQPADFRASLEQSLGRSLAAEFQLMEKKGLLPDTSKKRLSVGLLVGPNGQTPLTRHDPSPRISIWPALGFNNYDKLMAGVILTNFSLPAPRFQFLAIPMYAFGSKSFNGIGTASYDIFPQSGPFRKMELGVSGSRFTRDKYEDTTGKKTFMSFSKFVPRVRLILKEKSARSTFHRYAQFKTYFINEDQLTIRRDSIFNPTDTIIIENAGTRKEERTLAQLQLVIENFRALYPYRAELKAEHGKGFLRFAFTGNYFLNYAAKKGGVDLRFFAGKFVYTNKSKANRFLYGLNLSAPKGNLDYTYSDYFIGRNDYPFRADGIDWTLGYQQIMIRDGGLKVNTDAQGNTGYSDNWVAAINAAFDIPDRINPLSVLPFNIGLKIFVDAGTYAEAWEKGAATDRFLYDAGVQLSFAKQLINVYIPVLYSPVFKDYNKSVIPKKNRFLKTISFSIDIHKLDSKRYTKTVLPG